MGRFYTGDIEGKFWFGVQPSDDVENLVTITGNTYYYWHVCDCIAELDEYYCRQCYGTKEEHIEAAIEEDVYEEKRLYYEDCSHGYSMDKSTHYEELLTNMENLKKEIPEEIIKEIENIEQNDKILDAFTGVFDKVDTALSFINKIEEDNTERQRLMLLISRYILGYQIEYCLRTTDSCNISCEY